MNEDRCVCCGEYVPEGRMVCPYCEGKAKALHSHKVGDICLYEFDNENDSSSIVEIVKILNDTRGVAEIKFHKVICDDTGNGLFNYLYESGKTMNASLKYLRVLS